MAKRPAPAKSVHDSVPLPLGKSMCIRVIKVRPNKRPDFSDQIACDFSILDVNNESLVDPSDFHVYVPRLFRTEKSERVRYQALSYTWGHTPADRAIRLNGAPFRVRQNLWDFLDRARKNEVTGYLWIDAICIDQTRTRERNHQVAMMGEIYSRAARVIVWLGNCRRHVSRSLSARVDAYCQYNYKSPRKDCEHKSKVIEDFCFLPYWSRAWIAQEYFLAKRKSIWYGGLRIKPDPMEHMIKLWNFAVWSKPYLWNDQVWVVPKSTPAASLLTTQRLRILDGRGSEAVKFSTALVLFGLFERLECADSRDRIYALLSLLAPQQRRDLDVVPDYSKSATQIFLHVLSRLTHEKKEQRNVHLPDQFHNLERMLQPDLQNRIVQLKILETRAREDRCVADCAFAVTQDHHCGQYSEPYPVINARGCSRCHKIPVMSFQRSDSIQLDNTTHFSYRNWKAWVQILLKSHDKLDRELGAKICNDPIFLNLTRNGLW